MEDTLPGLGPEADVPGWLRDVVGLHCRSCDELVLWAMTGGHKAILVNAVPVANGNLQLLQMRGSVHAAVVPTTARTPGAVLHSAHFATCPAADQHRKRKAKR